LGGEVALSCADGLKKLKKRSKFKVIMFGTNINGPLFWV